MTLQLYMSRALIPPREPEISSPVTPPLQIVLDDGTNNPTITLDIDQYFISALDGSGPTGFVEHITEKMQAETGFSNAACTFDPATLKVTFSFDITTAVSFPFNSVSREAGNYLGFDSNLSGASSYVSPNAARLVWAPSNPPSGYPTRLGNFWEPVSGSAFDMSPSGETSGREGVFLRASLIEYALLPDSDVLKPDDGTSPNGTLEQFWEDAIHACQVVRIYPDKTATSSRSDFKVARYDPGGGRIGGFLEQAGRRVRSYNGLWDVSLTWREADEMR